MTEEEAREILMERMGNDYWFLPADAELEWVRQIMDGTFFVARGNQPSATQVAEIADVASYDDWFVEEE